jgi:hypothetical protein
MKITSKHADSTYCFLLDCLTVEDEIKSFSRTYVIINKGYHLRREALNLSPKFIYILHKHEIQIQFIKVLKRLGPGSSIGIATDYGLDGPGIETRWG